MSFPSQTTGLGVAAKILTTGNVNPGVTIPGKNGVRLSLSGVNGPTSFQLNPELVDVNNNIIDLGTQFVLTAVAGSVPGPLTLTAAAASVNGSTAYTGTITGGGSNALEGKSFTIAGFTNAGNNGTFICTASSTTVLTLTNTGGVLETHAGTATETDGTAIYTGTITGGGSNAFNGETFTVAGFATNASNNGTFICVGSSTTTLTLQNAYAVAETHAATATSQEATNQLTYVAYGARNATVPGGGTTAKVVSVSATGLLTTNGVEGHAVAEISFPTFNNTEGTTGAISPNPMYNLPKDKIYAEINVAVLV